MKKNLSFIIIAIVLFIIVKVSNNIARKKEALQEKAAGARQKAQGHLGIQPGYPEHAEPQGVQQTEGTEV